MSEFTYHDVLLKAAESVVEPGRWVQHVYYDESQNAGCAAWHIDQAAAALFGRPDSGPNPANGVASEARWALAPGPNRVCTAIGALNDAPDMTAEKMAEAMRKAAT